MAVSTVNLTRVSYNLRAFNLLESIRRNQRATYNMQTALATGLRFQRPSDDPLRASSAITLDRRMDRLDLIQNNLQRANTVLNEVDTSMQEAVDLLREAQALAIQALGDNTTPSERQALTVVVESLLDQLVSVGNHRYLNTNLFSGHQNVVPFERSQGGVIYRGDGNRMETMVALDLSQDSFTIPGLEFFRAVSAEVRGVVDLDPALTADTLVTDLNGALGRGVELGRILVGLPTEQSEIDLRGCVTVGDVVNKLNAELPSGLRARINTRSIELYWVGADRGPVSVWEVGGGRTAADLGLTGTFSGPSTTGQDLDPRVTLRTRVADLRAGAGVNLSAGLVVCSGGQKTTIQFNGVDTVEDILNRFNQADIGVWAKVADDGRSLEVRNRVSGADLTIEENGGLTATALGLRSMHGGTRLTSLNDGKGVRTVAGADFRITTRDNTTIDVDLDGARTLQEVISRLNAAGGGAIAASFVAQGNGLRIVDLTAGAGTLRIEELNGSLAATDLGLNVTATGNQLVGRDVNPVKVDSPFTALLELSAGMQVDDRLAMTDGAQRLERVLKQMQEVQGKLASQAKVMATRADHVETEVTATKVLISDVRDVDIADAAVRFQQLQTALQANLSTALQVLNLSLLDYLR